MLSPELVRDGQDEGSKNRYGRFAGTIAKSGLVSPSERLAYVRVAPNQPVKEGGPDGEPGRRPLAPHGRLTNSTYPARAVRFLTPHRQLSARAHVPDGRCP
jgi:hypothetical protein